MELRKREQGAFLLTLEARNVYNSISHAKLMVAELIFGNGRKGVGINDRPELPGLSLKNPKAPL
jgi:hypothetical protein